jgi:hypothetical protein
VTLENAASLENIRIARVGGAGDGLVKGVVNGSALGGEAKIINCEVSIIHAGTGSARAISMENDGNLEVWGSDLYAESQGDAYAVLTPSGAGGIVSVFNSRVRGTTAPFEQE